MNKTYIITDALTSIGQRLAQELSKNGHNLILSGDDYSGLEELHKNISENSDAHHEVFLLEQAKEIDWLNMVEKIESTYDGLNGIVFIHSIHTEDNSVYNVSYDEFTEVMDEHVWGTYLGVRTLRNQLIETKETKIINLVEPTDEEVFEHNLYYAVTGAIEGLTHALERELRKEDLDVYTLSYRPPVNNDDFNTNDNRALNTILKILDDEYLNDNGETIVIH
ncbi:SDR family NAD(P)-dependent oxidoreductase [Nosocomiicoccus ampullae]|uniref:SDR family NAD(P)-dependent oxidoreductase n=1 Tax=Nosocomiicoccus ampullae TaxID=489910 RepID=UPI001C5FC193|nr:SDR family oxidoreductase [Nosocomiicoccus ampullae]QYA48730.1 SDR family oxidoreductase [Nosocomiicoccus ampullae]